MIIEIFYKSRVDGKIKLVKRIDGVYADDGKTVIPTGFKIRQIGTDELFDEAIDPIESNRQYIETDEPIGETDTTMATEDDYQNALRDMGVAL